MFLYQCSEILHPSLVLGNEGLSSGLDPKVWEIYLWLYSTVVQESSFLYAVQPCSKICLHQQKVQTIPHRDFSQLNRQSRESKPKSLKTNWWSEINIFLKISWLSKKEISLICRETPDTLRQRFPQKLTDSLVCPRQRFPKILPDSLVCPRQRFPKILTDSLVCPIQRFLKILTDSLVCPIQRFQKN